MDANSSENLPVPRFCGIFRAMCPLRFAWETNTWITHPAAPITRAPQKKNANTEWTAVSLRWNQCHCLGLPRERSSTVLESLSGAGLRHRPGLLVLEAPQFACSLKWPGQKLGQDRPLILVIVAVGQLSMFLYPRLWITRHNVFVWRKWHLQDLHELFYLSWSQAFPKPHWMGKRLTSSSRNGYVSKQATPKSI